MIGMGMIEAENIFLALATFALNTHQFPRIDVVTVVRRICACVGAWSGGGHHSIIPIHGSQQNSATLVGISLFTMPADLVVDGLCELDQLQLSYLRIFELSD
jgi:hypothetical protein